MPAATFDAPDVFNLAQHLLGQRLVDGQGDRRALLLDDRALTYAEVDELANRFGNLLLEHGVRPEERVILALDDGESFVGALFGVLRVGAVVVMVNPRLPAEQAHGFLELTRATVVIAEAEVAALYSQVAEPMRRPPKVLAVGSADLTRGLDHAPTELEPFPTHPDDAAIWLFSGGTTGRPKAVLQTHRSFANTTELYGQRFLGMSPDDVTLSVPKLFFGYATGSNLFFPFSVGACAALFAHRCTADALFERIERHRPTILINVPTMIRQMVSHPDAPRHDLSCLRLATSAGEALPVDLHRQWEETFGVELLDGLGTAEMWHVFLSNRPGGVRPGTLGRAVPGFEVEVRDEAGDRLSPGEVGALWVRGDSRAIGYWQERGKTRETFRGEWVALGDMVTMDAEGFVTYCGRSDDMLKVHGKWLAPKELEDCLRRHPAVEEVAVIGARDDHGLIVPHAWVVARARVRDGEPGAEGALAAELQAWVRERLEPYKSPRAVHFLREMPRTHLGKVDRGKLGRGEA
ncbi:MAG TPA: benzoate-CoA ligase family protein [Thermoanaerobaculia bacterium]|nr:benzoate-CoA ligase family protein [Thermoanaerobaculia bacterium]